MIIIMLSFIFFFLVFCDFLASFFGNWEIQKLLYLYFGFHSCCLDLYMYSTKAFLFVSLEKDFTAIYIILVVLCTCRIRLLIKCDRCYLLWVFRPTRIFQVERAAIWSELYHINSAALSTTAKKGISIL